MERWEPLRRGIYAVEHEILEDGCEPSLSEIFGKVEQFPPPAVFLHLDRYDEQSPVDGHMPVFLWRTGLFLPLYIHLTGDGVPVSTRLAEEYLPSLNYSFGHLICPWKEYAREDNLTRVQVQYVAKDTVEVLVHSEWRDLDQCQLDDVIAHSKTLPIADCAESYRSIYRLSEACTAPCEHFLGQLEGGVSDGYPYERYAPLPDCTCPTQ